VRVLLALAGLVAALVVAAPARACPLPETYPGDDAAKEQIAQWMAHGAIAAGLPGELPVMGALVSSGLRNLNYGDADDAGFFAMRKAIWDTGAYAGFPDHPELQLQWFVDQATAVRKQWIADGRADPTGDEHMWGEWVADVERPAAEFRGRYQLRLDEARQLIGPPCQPASSGGGSQGGTSGGGTSQPGSTTDTVAPAVRVGGSSSQRALHRGAILLTVACPAESCVTSAAATVAVPGVRRAFRVTSRPRSLGAGQTGVVRVTLGARLRAAALRALRAHRAVRARVAVTTTDAAGNRTVKKRTVRVTG
jgi:hypothetical protein